MTITDAVAAIALVAMGYLLAMLRPHRAEPLAGRDDASATRGPRHEDLEHANRELRILTERLRIQAADLEESRAMAEQASRAKSDFLANVSHEIRTPMTSIVGMTDLALERAEAPEQVRHLQAVKTSADHLLTLVNDLLDLSKIEANRLELSPVAFRLRETIGGVLALLAKPAHAKGLALVHDIDDRVPDFLVGDVGRLRQIVLNLVGNAIKFTARGEVVVRIAQEDAAPRELSLHLEVADTGVGIAPDKQETIFAAFQQADGSTTRRFGGTGLGLTICAELARLMRGRIWLESTQGAGTTFHVTVRVHRQSQPTARPGLTPPDALRGRRVLLVEPHRATREAVARMLRGWQLGVDEAESAADVRRGPVAPDGTAYAAILIASRLADGRGFDLAASLRAGPSAPPAIVTLLTTEDERADRARSRTLHAAAVTKPVSHAALLATLCRALDIPADDGDVGESGETSRGAPDRALRILIAEDNPINQELIRTLLGRRGHATVVAETGLDAVDLVMRERFDAVLMDVQMPELDGLEATRAIRARERDSGRRTPIVALTAGTTDDARTRCEEAGMDAHLTKPIDAERLVETVESLAAASTHPTDPIHPTHPTDSASSPAIEIDRLMQRLDGDVDLLRRMTAAFLGDCPRTIGTLEVAIRRQDARAVEHAAHYLKGAGANLCAPALVGAAAELERAGRDGDLTHAEDLRDRLLSTLEALRVELTRAVQVQGATAVPASRTA